MQKQDNQPAGTRETAAERRQQALELRKQGNSYRAIGAALGVSEKTAHQDVQRALRALAALELASDCQVILAFCLSHRTPADEPSRKASKSPQRSCTESGRKGWLARNAKIAGFKGGEGQGQASSGSLAPANGGESYPCFV